ncbi:unnamed protein product [Owenia fusiformis]|uniref:Fucosyltransferase n=1 Tax=Owenia fusiformis TaxID=6347 RepID=A0A8S4Q731_OWEFU|nr:unnamed protein product [Owenia fusiformis]
MVNNKSEMQHKTDVIKILLWTKCFETTCLPLGASPFKNCDVPHCETTMDRSQLKQAQVVMFHTCYKENLVEAGGLPEYRSPNQKWIFRCYEAPSKQLVVYPEVNDAFNFTMTKRLDSDFHAYHGVYKVHPNPPKVLPDYAQNKTKLVAWIVSHCLTPGRREVYVRRLRKKMHIDIYGACGKHRCPPREKKDSSCYRHVGAIYKFYLAFENSDCIDYVTEKPWRSIRYNIVPVVRGSYNNFKTILPPGSYIHTNDFPNPEALAEYLKYLDKNDTAYNEYFSWKKTYIHDRTRKKVCDLCRTLHETRGVVKTYKNIWGDFYSFENNCLNYDNVSYRDFDK